MIISFDKFEQLEAPTLSLCNPNSEATIKGGSVTLSNTLGMLPDCKKVVLSPNFNTQWELSFEFLDSQNKQLHYMFKRLEKGRYIYVSDVGYFIIDSYTRHESDERTYKEVSCHSVDKEIERASCPLLDEGSYCFYTKDDQEGIIQKQMALLPKWTLDFVSDDLKEKTAYFDGENDAENAYEFLWDKIEEAYECVIDVDFISRKLSFYSLEYYAAHHLTDIHLSKSNDLKEVVVESKDDDCFTAITVKQDDKLSLVYSNPNGSETLYNFDYVMGDMSSELQNAIEKWKAKYEATIIPYRTLSEQWATALDDLSNAEKDLDILKEELNNLKRDRDTVINTTATDDNKQTALTTVNANITAKEQAISAQENVVATKKANIQTTYETPLQNYAKECSLKLTAVDVDGNQIFTQESLNELSAYINPAEYSDEYITQTDDMKYAEIYQQSNKLFDRATVELEKLSTQSYTFSVDNNSFLFSKKFERFSKQLCPGAIVYLETSDDRMEQVHLTNYSIDYDEQTVSFTFGNKYDKNDIKSLYDDVFGNIKTSATAVKYLKNIVNDQRSELEKQRTWIDNALILTKDHALMSNNQAVIIDDSGYWGKRQSTDKDGNPLYDTKGNPIYDNEQIKIINNGIYLTTDNWGTISTAVGKIYLYHDEETGEDVFRYGVAGDVIVGNLFLGRSLALLGSPRADGTYAITLNENGLTIINDGTTAGIIIKDVYGNKQFYADENGNLHLTGTVVADSGKIAGLTLSNGAMFKAGGWNLSNGLYQGYSSGLNAVYNHSVGRDIFIWVGDYRTSSVHQDSTVWDNIWASEISQYDWKAVSSAWGTTVQDSIKNSAPFYVTWDGELHASNATITGNITATSGSFTGSIYSQSGTIGGWQIDGGRIYNYNAATGYTFSLWNPGTAGGTIISCDNGSSVPFYVNRDGFLYASNATIAGTIQAGSIVALNIEGSGSSFSLGKLSLWNNSQGTVFYSPYNGAYNRAYLSLGYTSSTFAMSQGVGITIESSGIGRLTGSWAYTNGSSGSLSDKLAKKDIESFTSEYNTLFDGLNPCLYKYIDGTSGRKHFGFIAQETEDAISKSKLSQKDVAFIMDMEFDTGNGNKENKKFLRYEEFIALNTWQIQQLKLKVQKLEDKIAELKIGSN